VTEISRQSGRKKLLVLTSTFPRWEGDTEPPFVFELCKRLSPDFDIWVLAPHAPGAKTREMMDNLTVVRFRYCFERGETLAYRGGILANLRDNRLRYLLVPMFFGSQLFALLRLLCHCKFDIVNAHWLIPQGLTATAARTLFFRSFPALLCTVHGSDLNGLQGPLMTALKRLVIRRSDALATVSAAMNSCLRSLGTGVDNTSVISMGIDTLNTFLPSHKTKRHSAEILFVGRLSAQKGTETLIRAMPDVLRHCPDSKLRIIGRGPERAFLEALSQQLGIKQSIEFLGPVNHEDLPEFYRKATVFVFPSLTAEGFGLVCVEALACECPVIASDLPAAQEIIQDGQTGLLFQQGNEKELAQKIIALLANPSLRYQMGKAGRSFVTPRYDWTTTALRYRDLLHGIERKTL